MTAIDVSIVIVTYNSEKDIYPCLKSLENSKVSVKIEIIIVDNDSKDATCDIIEKFKLNTKLDINLLKSKNNGFNAGNNIGIKKARGNYILLLNPDTEVFKSSIENLYLNAIKINKLGSLGCVLVDQSGNEIFSAGYFPSVKSCLKKLSKRNYFKINYKKTLQSVDFPSGAAFLFRKSIIDKIGYMDENYFIYFDETDFAFQMKKMGFANYILTSTQVIHKFGQSTSTIPEFSIEKSIQSYIYFINKNYNFYYGSIIKNLEFCFHFLRYFASYVYKRNKKDLFKFYLKTYLKNYISFKFNR
jgi:GT2 family glycosyltransferase